jgi:hypothetical protein
MDQPVPAALMRERKMRWVRRLVRDCVASVLGIRSYVEIWWTPELPLLYINNPKCGCSTVKNSLKQAQAARFRNQGLRDFMVHRDPHVPDDCLQRHGVGQIFRDNNRLVLSCVRNPYTRALSAYLDKVASGDIAQYRELKGRRPASFEEFLSVVAAAGVSLDPHFARQSVNLDLPNVKYDAIFYLENIACLQASLRRLFGDFAIETFAPHSRSAHQKVQDFYTPRAAELVQDIYADDFARFGYSRDLDQIMDAPGACWTRQGIVPRDEHADLTASDGIASLMPTLRYQRLVEARLI